jgi:hypothetical protein
VCAKPLISVKTNWKASKVVAAKMQKMIDKQRALLASAQTLDDDEYHHDPIEQDNRPPRGLPPHEALKAF